MDKTEQEKTIALNIAVARLNDAVLTISGTVLGFSVAFLSKADFLESTILLQVTWIFLAISISANVGTKMFDM